MGTDDPWTAPDKVYHVIFCFTITIIFSFLSSVAPHPFLRRRRLFIAASLSLSAGAAKEFADYLGFFHSSGASARDAVADVIGVVLALPIAKFLVGPRHMKHDPDEERVGGDGIGLV